MLELKSLWEMVGAGPFLVGILIIIFSVAFIWFYVRPAWTLARQLTKSIKKIEEVQGRATGPISIEDIAPAFGDERLSHFWSEYAESLHEQFVYVDGERQLQKIRATIPAEAFFSTQAVVDSRIHAEFFRHLPGMLTGIGIIGTFYGLVIGLHNFNPSSDPSALDASLKGLFSSVMEAFVASGCSIFAAMLVTLLEKLFVAWDYRCLGRLVQAIDHLFEAGAGEEYLSRLVKSSEESSTQTKQLKDSFVGELKTILTELTDRQIESQTQASAAIAQKVSDSIKASLEGPLSTIADVVGQASGQQGSAVQSLLTDLLSSFMAKLDDTIGGQMRGLAEMMQESSGTIREMQAGFDRLVRDFSGAGENASRVMAEKLNLMMAESEERQRQMSEKLAQSVEQLHAQLGQGNSDMQRQMAESMQGMREVVGTMISDISLVRQQQSQDSADETRKLKASIEELIDSVSAAGAKTTEQYGSQMSKSMELVQDSLGSALKLIGEQSEAGVLRNDEILSKLGLRIGELVSNTQATNEAMRDVTQRFVQVSANTVEGMNRGADKMRLAAEGFTSAGNTINGVVERGGELFGKISEASRGLEASSTSLVETVSAYNQSRGSLEKMVGTLQLVTSDAETRVGLSKELLMEMEVLTKEVSRAQSDARDYFANITEVLGEAFDKFDASMTKSIDHNRGSFDSSLSGAVQMIRGALSELEVVLSEFVDQAKSNAK